MLMVILGIIFSIALLAGAFYIKRLKELAVGFATIFLLLIIFNAFISVGQTHYQFELKVESYPDANIINSPSTFIEIRDEKNIIIGTHTGIREGVALMKVTKITPPLTVTTMFTQDYRDVYSYPLPLEDDNKAVLRLMRGSEPPSFYFTFGLEQYIFTGDFIHATSYMVSLLFNLGNDFFAFLAFVFLLLSLSVIYIIVGWVILKLKNLILKGKEATSKGVDGFKKRLDERKGNNKGYKKEYSDVWE